MLGVNGSKGWARNIVHSHSVMSLSRWLLPVVSRVETPAVWQTPGIRVAGCVHSGAYRTGCRCESSYPICSSFVVIRSPELVSECNFEEYQSIRSRSSIDNLSDSKRESLDEQINNVQTSPVPGLGSPANRSFFWYLNQ